MPAIYSLGVTVHTAPASGAADAVKVVLLTPSPAAARNVAVTVLLLWQTLTFEAVGAVRLKEQSTAAAGSSKGQ